MPSSSNTIIIACAGSGKTTRLVSEAISCPNRRIAFVTYTNNNIRVISRRLADLNSGPPKHVDVITWFSFLLRECARPYQRFKYGEKRIKSLLFINRQSTRGIPESNTRQYYFAGGELIYSDKISRFVVECDMESCGAVTKRLAQIYTDIFIDECQDLSAWDWEFIELLLRSNVRITLVGDPRQSILCTSPSSKNRQYRKSGVTLLMGKWEAEGICRIETMDETYRCNQDICDLANILWPRMERMTSLSTTKTKHDGVFLVSEDDVGKYYERFRPQVLRHSKRAKDFGLEAMNFGIAKGTEHDRVLIIPTNPIKAFLKSGDPDPLRERHRLHVAITRARSSVAFVYDGESPVVHRRWRASASGDGH
jgi:DNA helicase-2/ATP-dependent DNA helicase PcrA